MQEIYIVTVDDLEYGNISVSAFTTRDKALEYIEWLRHEMLKSDPTSFRFNNRCNEVYTIYREKVDIIGYGSSVEDGNFKQNMILYDKDWKPFVEWQKQNVRDPMIISLEIDELEKKYNQVNQLKGHGSTESRNIWSKIYRLKEDLKESNEVHKTITN